MRLNIDKFGLITKVQDDGSLEGGDTLANEGTYESCQMLYDRSSSLSVLEYEPGVYRRHPDETMWYAQPGRERLSRDQMIPVLSACAVNKDHARARRFAKRHLLRGLLFMTNTRRNGATPLNHGTQYKGNSSLSGLDSAIIKYSIPIIPIAPGFRNYSWKMPDLTLLGFWALLIRACGYKLLYPLLLVLDVSLLVDFLMRRFVKSDPDVRNYVLPLLVTATVLGTPLSKLVRYLSKKFLNLNELVTQWFTSPGEPELHIILVPAMKKGGLSG